MDDVRPAAQEPTMESDLATWGKAITLETTGRRSGLPRRVTIGYIEAGADLLVAASSPATQWARNLLVDPHCYVERSGRRFPCRAVALDEIGRESAVVGLILKYGTPAERLGAGPAFRLEPV